jgi:hypothetical protein
MSLLSLAQLLLETATSDDYNILWGRERNIHYFVDFSLDKLVRGTKMPLHNSGKYGVPYQVVLTGGIPLPGYAYERKKGIPFSKEPGFPICVI